MKHKFDESETTKEIIRLFKCLLGVEDIEYTDEWPLLVKWLDRIEKEKLDVRLVSREY